MSVTDRGALFAAARRGELGNLPPAARDFDLTPHDDEPLDEDDFEIIEPENHEAPWPTMKNEAFHGLAGDVVRLIGPTTEADPVAVLVTTLTFFGNACGREPRFQIGTGSHRANLFTAIVGATGEGRKGTSKEGPELLMSLADPDWAGQRLQGGLSSGEGVIDAIRDSSTQATTGDSRADQGVDDKRLMLMEDELSQGLKAAQRQGSTTSEIIRKAWDSSLALRTMTKTSPSRATGPHVSLVGHITPSELTKMIGETELANGFANRFSWYRVQRSKFLPNPLEVPDYEAREVAGCIKNALAFAQNVGQVRRDRSTEAYWADVYPDLARGQPGLSGALIARRAPIVMRHALIYALLDSSPIITVDHLAAALASWEYAEASVKSLFGDLTGDAVADRILGLLRSSGAMTQTEISDALGRNQSAARLANALHILHTSKRVIAKRKKKPGKPGPSPTIYELNTEGSE